MAKEKEKVEESREERLKRIRKEAEEAIRNAPVKNPKDFDASRIQAALDDLAKVKDENLDAYLVLNKPLTILMKQIAFDPEEVKKFKAFFEGYGINKEVHSPQEDRTRDDWMFNIKGPKYPEIGVWINKSQPMYGNKGYYNILWFGGMLSPYMKNFLTLDEMLEHIKKKAEDYH